MQSRPSEVTMRARRLRLTIAGLAAVGVLLAGPAARAAFLPLPANGSQVNNDVANAIDPNQDAGVSDVTGGTLTAGKVQIPWATFEPNDGVASDTTLRQIFVAKALKQATAGAACPVGTKPAGGNNENGFCWQQVGLDRLDPDSPTSLDKGDPTLNIDPTRSGVEPDIAFTGKDDTVAWVVWYEEDPTGISGLRNNDMVFAARIVADGAADGGVHWLSVGNGTAGRTHVP